MATPKKKTSPSRRGKRRSHDYLKPLNISFNENGEPQLSHMMAVDGTYRGRVVKLRRDKDKSEQQS